MVRMNQMVLVFIDNAVHSPNNDSQRKSMPLLMTADAGCQSKLLIIISMMAMIMIMIADVDDDSGDNDDGNDD